MGSEAMEKILRQGRPGVIEDEAKDKFFGVLMGEGVAPAYLDIRMRAGTRLALDYETLNWFYHDPEANSIEMEFGTISISVRGRGLTPLYQNFLRRRVEWMKEADSDMQDHKDNDSYIENIVVILDSGEGQLTEQ